MGRPRRSQARSGGAILNDGTWCPYFEPAGEGRYTIKVRATDRVDNQASSAVPLLQVSDLAVVIASDRPLFGNSRPVVESQDAYMAALAGALRTARASGTRVVVRPLVVETVARR